MTCSIDARWNDAPHSIIKSDDYGIGNVGNSVYAVLRGSNARANLITMSPPFDDGSWRHVSADQSWLKGALGYEAPYNTRYQLYFKGVDRQGYTTTALATFVLARAMYTEPKSTSIEFWRDSIPAIESVMSTAFAEVMSRTGSVREINRNVLRVDSVKECQMKAESDKYKFCPPPPAIEAEKSTQLHFNGSRTGYAYQASSATDYLSIFVLALYVTIVLFHNAGNMISCHSFTCWDSVEDMLLLAKNSQRTFIHQRDSTDPSTPSSGIVAPQFSERGSNENEQPARCREGRPSCKHQSTGEYVFRYPQLFDYGA